MYNRQEKVRHDAVGSHPKDILYGVNIHPDFYLSRRAGRLMVEFN